ncbi:hypothetical protein V7O61_00185 [Methanolobus sp. WCC1]|uniref:hypothetical protein n=1 Tax=unclassified Methanolobus TaxID=2629569 RepID=UPI003255C037
MACTPQEPQDPIDKSDEKKIIKVVSSEIALPENYDILRNPDTGGFVVTYQNSSNSVIIIDISDKYEIIETWTATRSEIAGGHQILLVSDKGNEKTITIAGDLSSNTGEITIFDSSSSEITVLSYDCKSSCFMTCGTLGGMACRAGCASLCTTLGIAYVPCLAACLLWCVGVDITVYCTEICNAVC